MTLSRKIIVFKPTLQTTNKFFLKKINLHIIFKSWVSIYKLGFIKYITPSHYPLDWEKCILIERHSELAITFLYYSIFLYQLFK